MLSDVLRSRKVSAGDAASLAAFPVASDSSLTSVRELTAAESALSTEGGTSDGRFVAPTGAEVVELGPVNATIHKVNECVKVEDLELLSKIYERVTEILLADARR